MISSAKTATFPLIFNYFNQLFIISHEIFVSCEMSTLVWFSVSIFSIFVVQLKSNAIKFKWFFTFSTAFDTMKKSFILFPHPLNYCWVFIFKFFPFDSLINRLRYEKKRNQKLIRFVQVVMINYLQRTVRWLQVFIIFILSFSCFFAFFCVIHCKL